MPRVLLVTEDADFIPEARDFLGPDVALVACMGPAQRTCLMERDGVCALCQRATVALVDAPVTGSFFDHYDGIPALRYAEELAEAHPHTEVVLCDPVQHGQIPSAFLSRTEALELVRAKVSASTPKGD